MVDNPELNQQEVEHGTLSSDRTIGLSGLINLLLSLLGKDLLLLDLHRGLLGDFELLNKLHILKDSL